MELRGFKDADGSTVQPYFAAYMIEMGFRSSSEAKAYEYMIWNSARWTEFEKATNRPLDGHRRGYAAEFEAWLQERASGQTTQAEVA